MVFWTYVVEFIVFTVSDMCFQSLDAKMEIKLGVALHKPGLVGSLSELIGTRMQRREDIVG